jgi:hypothetical protein
LYVGSAGKYKLQDIILQITCSKRINTKFHDLVLQLSRTRDINNNSRIHPSWHSRSGRQIPIPGSIPPAILARTYIQTPVSSPPVIQNQDYINYRIWSSNYQEHKLQFPSLQVFWTRKINTNSSIRPPPIILTRNINTNSRIQPFS